MASSSSDYFDEALAYALRCVQQESLTLNEYQVQSANSCVKEGTFLCHFPQGLASLCATSCCPLRSTTSLAGLTLLL